MGIKLGKDDLKPGTKLAALPAGIHTVKIKATAASATMAKLELTVTKSTNKKAIGKKTFDNIVETVSWKIGQLLASLGLEKKAAKVKTIKDLVKLIDGMTVRIRSVQQTTEEYGTQSKVKQYLPVEAAADEDDDDDEEDEVDEEEDSDDEDEDEEEEDSEEEDDDEDSDDEDEDEDEDDDEEEDDDDSDDEDDDSDDEEEEEEDEDEDDDEDEDEEEEPAPKKKKAKAAPAAKKSSKKRR